MDMYSGWETLPKSSCICRNAVWDFAKTIKYFIVCDDDYTMELFYPIDENQCYRTNIQIKRYGFCFFLYILFLNNSDIDSLLFSNRLYW